MMKNIQILKKNQLVRSGFTLWIVPGLIIFRWHFYPIIKITFYLVVE